jgi:hypothetical protein
MVTYWLLLKIEFVTKLLIKSITRWLLVGYLYTKQSAYKLLKAPTSRMTTWLYYDYLLVSY